MGGESQMEPGRGLRMIVVNQRGNLAQRTIEDTARVA